MEVPPDSQHDYAIQQRILSRAMFHLRAVLGDVGTASFPSRERVIMLKESETSNVGTFMLPIEIDLEALATEGYRQFEQRVREHFTNNDFVDSLNAAMRIYAILKNRFQSAVSSTNLNPESLVKVSELAHSLGNKDVTAQDLAQLFGSRVITVKALQDLIVENKLSMSLPVVYKQVFGKNLDEQLQNEINMSRTFALAHFGTVNTLDLIDSYPEFAVTYTVRKDMTLFSDIPNIFDASKGIFKKLMEELARLHSLGLTHGDLNLNNIGYNKGIIFFDLTYGHYAPGDSTTIANENLILARNLNTAINRLRLSDDDKRSAIDAVHAYLNTVVGSIGLENVSPLIARSYNQNPIVTNLDDVKLIRYYLGSVIQKLSE